MSEMKPIAWAIPHHMPNDTYPHCELVLYRKQAAQNTLALYTAEQLAEAVAAERERIAAIWDVKAETALECMKSSGKDGHHFQQIYKSRLEIAEAIRSAAK